MAIHVLADALLSRSGYEPQRQNNFAVQVVGLNGPGDSDLITLALDSAFAPRIRNEEIVLPYGNEVVYGAGRAVADPGSLVLRDFVDREVLSTMINWRRQVYDPADGHIGLAAEYKKIGYVIMFGSNSRDGAPTFTRQWKLLGLWPTSLNPAGNGLTMNASGPVLIEVPLRFDKAIPGNGAP